MSLHPFKVSLFFGVPMLLTAILLQVIGPVDAGNLPPGFQTPVMAFEFMASAEETSSFFAVENPLMYRNDFMLGNTIDYLFMFFYSVFLAFTGIGIVRESGLKVIWLPVVLCILVFFADLLENVTMASITDAYFNGDPLVDSFYGNLRFFTWLKWGGIAAIFLMMMGYYIERKVFGKFIAILMLSTFVLSVGAFFHRSILNEIMALNVAVVFLLLFIFNVVFKPESTPISAATGAV